MFKNKAPFDLFARREPYRRNGGANQKIVTVLGGEHGAIGLCAVTNDFARDSMTTW